MSFRTLTLAAVVSLLISAPLPAAWAVSDNETPPAASAIDDKIIILDAQEAEVEPAPPLEPLPVAPVNTETIVVAPVSAATTEQRAWLRIVDSRSGGLATLDVRFAAETVLTAPLVFEGELSATTDLASISVALVARDADGEVRHSADLKLQSEQGFTPFRFVWDLAPLADGEYDVLIRAAQPTGFELSRLHLKLLKFSWPGILGAFESARENVDQVQAHLAGIDSSSLLPYPRMRLAVADAYLDIAWSSPNDWLKLYENAHFAERVAESIRARLTFNPGRPGSETAFLFDPEDVEVRNGLFESSGRPVFFTGLHGLNMDSATIARIAEYGLNLAVERVADPSAASLAERYNPIIAAATGHRVGVAFVSEATSGNEALAAYLEQKPNVVSLALDEAPVFAFENASLESAFREVAIARYGDRHRINRTWRTRLIELEEIGIWPDYNRTSYQYDLQSFWRDLAERQMSVMIADVRAQAPDVPLQLVFEDDQFAPGTGRYTVEYEGIAPHLTVSGLRVAHSPEDPVYAMSFPRNLVGVAYWRSIAPQAPVFTLEHSLPHDPDLRGPQLFRFLHSLVWEGAVEGVGAYAMEVTPGAYTYLSRPEGLEGLATAHLDINRLGTYVAEFARAPIEVGIVVSESSKLFEDGETHLSSAVRAYEGVSWGGMKVGFVTEALFAGGALPPLKVLVVPETPAMTDEAFAGLQAVLELPPGAPGPVVIRVAKPIPYTPWGMSRRDLGTFGRRAMLVRGEDSPTEYLHALDAGLAEDGTFRDPRAINANGYILEGVRTRFVRIQNEPYLYLINLRQEPVQVHLNGSLDVGVDLISGQRWRFPTEVAPLMPMLLRMDAAGANAVLALEGEEEFEVPTAAVKPVPPPAPEN